MSDQGEAALLRTMYEHYFDRWNHKDVDALSGLFAFPLVIGGGGRDPAIVPDAQAYRTRMNGALDDLTARGWKDSVLDECYIGFMAGETAVITVQYHRDREDGSRLEGGTSNYLTRKINGSWKIVGILAP